MKLVLVLGIFLAISMAAAVEAAVPTANEMEEVCRTWLSYIVDETGGWAGATDPQIVDAIDIVANDTLLGRYYSISPSGYIIVPALKELAPIKAYSEKYSFGVDDADGMGLMLKQVFQNRFRNFVSYYGNLEATYDIATKSEPLYGSANIEKWDILSAPKTETVVGGMQTSASTIEEFGPLLKTAWHQGYPYNKFCPVGYESDTCVVGCVATAAAQIVYYHMWPPFGQGEHSYFWSGDQSCEGTTAGQQLSADFSDPYEFSYDNDALAELCYEMGVAFDMDYGVCASGAYTMEGVNIFPDYFRYDITTKAVYRDNFNEYFWFQKIKEQINRGLPTLYRIYLHAMVCDGWREAFGFNQIHINYGWGGSNNGWYTIDELHCDWDGCDPMEEAMVIGIVPLTGIVMLSSDNLSDVAGGDGDGLPEPGETIDISLKIANYGGGSISNLSMDLYLDDASIIVLDGSSSISYIPSNDSADNSADPFQIEIPMGYFPRIDSLYFVLSWDVGGNTKIDTMVLEKTIGGSSILLVKDDMNDTLDTFYKNNFEAMRIPYDVWVQNEYNDPDSSDLNAYGIVVWYTGDYRSSPLSTGEIAAMKGFLNAGGNLFLTGQGIAPQLATLDVDFLNNYLKASYNTTAYIPLLAGWSGGQIFSLADSIGIYSNGGASNQTKPDHIEAVGDGVPEINYLSYTNKAAVSYSGSYKSVFFSFGFESITVTSSKYLNQDSVLARILSFFNYQNPITCPRIANIIPTPGEPLNLTDHTPEINWSYFDPQGYPQLNYHIQVDSDSNWTFIENWEYGPEPGTDTVTTYAGAELVDGEMYYVRIRAFNGILWSGWSYCRLEMNAPPTMPSNLTPRDLEGVTNPTPRLEFTNSTDLNSDKLFYMLEIYDDSLMTTLISHKDSLVQIYPNYVFWNVDVTLMDDEDYFWRVRVSDGYEPSEWTDLARFWINSVNNAPTDFVLISPEDGNGGGRLPHFVWQASHDIDLYDSLYYSLYYATNPAFSQAVSVNNLIDTQYTLTTPLTDSLYYWKVSASDLFYGTKISNTHILYPYIRGDANGDNSINIGDIVFLIGYIFKGSTPPASIPEGDANCDGSMNIGDAVYLSYYIFKNGSAPQCDE